MDDKIFKADAKVMVDMIFDKNLFHEDMTRDMIQSFEDLIAFHMQSRVELHIRSQKFLESIKNFKTE